MMTPNRIKTKLEFYRKWFDTMKIKEFMNLPIKDQNKCLAIFDKFVEDCKRIHEEAKSIKEKVARISVDSVWHGRIITGAVKGTDISMEIKIPEDMQLPRVGDILTCTLFSFDEENWYSSKTELITEK